MPVDGRGPEGKQAEPQLVRRSNSPGSPSSQPVSPSSDYAVPIEAPSSPNPMQDAEVYWRDQFEQCEVELDHLQMMIAARHPARLLAAAARFADQEKAYLGVSSLPR